MNELVVDFPRGACTVRRFGTPDPAVPRILFFPDAFGPRPASFAVAEALAAEGWCVLMPEPFYDHAPFEPIAPKSIFERGPAHDRLMGMFGSVTADTIAADVGALIATAERETDDATPFAAVGYCMGGLYALTAACASPRIRFAASIHGSNLAPATGAGSHPSFAAAKGRIYVAVAGIDPSYGAAEHGRLACALREAETDHVIETFVGVAHGWVFEDIPVYDRAAADRHLRRLKEHLCELF